MTGRIQPGQFVINQSATQDGACVKDVRKLRQSGKRRIFSLSAYAAMLGLSGGMMLAPTVSIAEEDTAPTHTIQVTFRNVTPETGMLWASLCTKSEFDNLGSAPCFQQGRVPASNGATMEFENVPSNTYAISVFHDANDNGVLDFNSRGIPDEPTGNSGNAQGFFGPPRFDQMKFKLTDEHTDKPRQVVIKMMSLNIP